ncbi:TPA: hypothetical protein TZS81_001086 [Streptococcus suis]|nr:hypothetical protein [Streptococcus suis]HEL2395991.1 hypothetical protein [Streptococcus suis]HEL9617684.1 hypothetical protein [Streptococcus suis]HEL9648694.1 hypothetical protein [Streptococcus suis]
METQDNKTKSFVYVFELKKDCFSDKASRNRAIKQIETLLKKSFSDATLEPYEERIAVLFALENMSNEEALEKIINWLDDLWCRSAITIEE